MISGYNTDVEYQSVTYHVQTEDKGLDSPLILSLVYTGGEIIAAKRSPYADLIADGFDPKVLEERLHRQHKLICAAIVQGRVEDLKKMSARDTAVTAPVVSTASSNGVSAQLPAAVVTTAPTIVVQELNLSEVEPLEVELLNEVPAVVVEDITVIEDDLPEINALNSLTERLGAVQPLIAPPKTFVPKKNAQSVAPDALHLALLEETELYAGDTVDFRVLATRGAGELGRPLENVEITVKILGAAFRPIVHQLNTGRNGTASLILRLPLFKTGRAALLVRAVSGKDEAELRRIILQRQS